jgi:hypothetical protein
MNAKEFATKLNIPLLGPDSEFPEYYAAHVIADESVLEQDHLLSTNLLKEPNLTCKIDEYLDTTKFVFFSLGKGYLKTKGAIGLIYDPFMLVKTPGANLVLNDLLYILDESKLLQEFCQKYKIDILQIIDFYALHIISQLEKIPALEKIKLENIDLKDNFIKNLKENKSLLVCDIKDYDHLVFVYLFENILDLLSEDQKNELKELIKKEITDPNTINQNLEMQIKDLFANQKDFLNKFSDKQTEERMIELRIPNKHLITNGLIGIYQS